MVEQDQTPSKVTQAHLQSLVSQRFMMVVELATCRVPEHLTSPAPMEGHVVAFMAFYERGFGVPLHRLLCSLLHHYILELHNLTPSGILHITTFITLCETYKGIDPHFDLWNHFLRVRCPKDPDMEITVSRGMVIHV
jgi:hypothetical protein